MQKSPRTRAFDQFESVAISLYDGGVLSPAVLERVIRGFASIDVEWTRVPKRQAVDGHSLHEIIARTMLSREVPGDSASESFRTVIEHILGAPIPAGAAKPGARKAEGPRQGRRSATKADDVSDIADELVGQLARSARQDKRRRDEKPSKRPSTSAFNPFSTAALPRSHRT
ncbi:hypothetical protein SAMN05443245_7373 [Paraburkholderia fungorum]|uniref:Uncharacterized protein n=1 Tax=Paraburkholderia fungorum TaxID=134537 RepID=A0A1H1JW41_9BURK|nr:hypothetical protein SAMN05443245_7373 [Paraburkholderia fungorum]